MLALSIFSFQTKSYLEEKHGFDPFQFGFRSYYGSETSLVTLYNDLLREADRESHILLVLLDLSVTFDAISHGSLLNRLLEVGIWVLMLSWLCCFLGDYVQRVHLGEELSAPWTLDCVVPQGLYQSAQ